MFELKWVKNVKREGGTDWAYSEYKTGDIFDLNWPKQFRGNVLRARVGECILIFQTLSDLKGTFLTHIVTPLDTLLQEDYTSTHPYKRTVFVVASSDPIDSIPKPAHLNFYRPNRGAVCAIDKIIDKRYPTTDIERLMLEIWTLFGGRNIQAESTCSRVIDSSGETTYLEGAELWNYKKHKSYERNRNAVEAAKILGREQGRFYCEVCGFDFSVRYGVDFLECHHKLPIANNGVRETRVEDLALVCSNCHRMLHKKINNRYLTVQELKVVVDVRRQNRNN